MERNQPQRGQSLVEFAIILPVLLIIAAGALDLGRLYFSYVAVTDAASEGAAYAAAHPRDESAVVERARDASTITAADSDVEYFCPTCPAVSSGDPITVTVTYSFTLATPIVEAIVPGGVIPLRAVTTEAILGGALE
ncbi:MAG: pilus assembly protein [Anaerolineae bacterium]